MSKVLEFYNNRSIHSKMMMNMLFVVVMSVVILSYMNISVLNRSLTGISNEQAIEMAGQVTLRIENFIEDTDKTLRVLSLEPAIIDYATKGEREKEALETLSRFSGQDKNIAGILLANRQGDVVSNTMRVIEDNPLTLESWYIETAAGPQAIHLFSQAIGRNVTSFYDSYKADNVLSVTKAIRDESGQVSAVLLMDMKLDYIESILNSAGLGQTGFLYITDKYGDVVYAPVNNVVYRIHPSMITKDREVTIGDAAYQVIVKETGIANWRIVGVFPKNVTLNIILEIIRYFILYAALILLFAVFLSSVLTRSLTKPISMLKNLMKDAEEGKLDVRFESPYDDEIHRLGMSFNTMIDSINNLLELVYVEQKEKREAELRAFQAQIKPHFLYNTLDTINWMAIEYDAEDIVEVVDSLTNLFRISLSKGNEWISLENEVKHVTSYLTIQMVRYEDQFDYRLAEDSSLMQYRVIKLIIQPLVENAIYHGIKGIDRHGVIDIRIYEGEEAIYIEVEDNGMGMDAAKTEHFNQIFRGEAVRSADYGIGLFNVNERIKLNFGNAYGLSIESSQDKGTKVIIKHPKRI